MSQPMRVICIILLYKNKGYCWDHVIATLNRNLRNKCLKTFGMHRLRLVYACVQSYLGLLSLLTENFRIYQQIGKAPIRPEQNYFYTHSGKI